MRLRQGDRLGPYEIVSPLGAGGMGEVYRARDPRLGRDVALKVLPPESSGPDRAQRFEREARAVAALRHPHILAVYDVGSHEGQPYIVLELLEGETLRQRLSHGPLPVSKVVEFGVQVCQGLAAAHAHGVVHRDLKPENLFLSRDSGVKILDFGLAKLYEASGEANDDQPTATATDRGVWLGTPGYVSPEQLRGTGTNARSDIFALGAVLYEMLAGQRAFKGASRADTLSAILDRDPPPMEKPGEPVPPSLERVVRRCLEKDPEDRFQSARDVAFALEALSSATGRIPEGLLPGPSRFRWLKPVLMGLLVAAASGAAGLWYGKRMATRPLPTFTPLTSERGVLYDARFTPDGRTVVYSAAWEGNPPEVFSTRIESPVPRPFGFPPGGVQSVSSTGELLLLRNRPGNVGWPKLGTLARVPFAGGAPRDVLEDVAAADWAPDGSLCVLRRVGGEMQLEWPIGTVLYRSASIPLASFVRVSPRGDEVAFREDRARGSALQLADRSGRVRTLALPGDEYGYAWSDGGQELWYIDNRVLYAVDRSGRRRAIHSLGALAFLFDISAEGRVLLAYVRGDNRVSGRAPGERTEHDLTTTPIRANALSPDGQFLLATAYWFGQHLLVRLRGGAPVQLGALGHPEGSVVDLSTGGERVLFLEPGPPPRLVDVPTGAGEPRTVSLGAVEPVAASWFRDGVTVLIRGHEPGRPDRLFVKRPGDAAPRPLTPEGNLLRSFASSPEGRLVGSFAASPDGAWVAVHEPSRIRCYPVAGGEPRDVPGYDGQDLLLGWSSDGRFLYLRRDPDALAAPAQLFRLDVQTGRQSPWMELLPPERQGLMFVHQVRLALDGQAYAYFYARNLHNLYIVDGLK
jgi:eukaryotic-like serine/threonine-protein kinase